MGRSIRTLVHGILWVCNTGAPGPIFTNATGPGICLRSSAAAGAGRHLGHDPRRLYSAWTRRLDRPRLWLVDASSFAPAGRRQAGEKKIPARRTTLAGPESLQMQDAARHAWDVPRGLSAPRSTWHATATASCWRLWLNTRTTDTSRQEFEIVCCGPRGNARQPAAWPIGGWRADRATVTQHRGGCGAPHRGSDPHPGGKVGGDVRPSRYRRPET